MRRVRLQGSLVGWVPRSNSTVLDILGLGTENINVEVALNGEPDAAVFGDESNVDGNEYNKQHDNEDFRMDNNEQLRIDHENTLVDLSTNKCKPLTPSVFQSVTSHMSSFYEVTQEEVKFIVGAMAIKMKDLV